jgi:hypothetical protein
MGLRRWGLAVALSAALGACGTTPGVDPPAAAPDGPSPGAGDAQLDLTEARSDAATADVLAAEVTADLVPAGEDWTAFSGVFAALYCRRIFSCCERADRFTGDDDEETCARKERAVVLSGNDFIERGLSRYDREAATACFRELAVGSCAEVFGKETGRFIACQDVLVGLGAPGALCEADVECASNRCVADQCAVVPPARCAPTQFVDPLTLACRPRGVIDSACQSRAQCAPGLTCAAGVCGEALLDGAPCRQAEECAGTCSSVKGDTMGVCRPGICQGA